MNTSPITVKNYLKRPVLVSVRPKSIREKGQREVARRLFKRRLSKTDEVGSLAEWLCSKQTERYR